MLKSLLKKYNDQVELTVITGSVFSLFSLVLIGDRESEEEILAKTKVIQNDEVY